MKSRLNKMPRTYKRTRPQDSDLEENIKKAVAAVKDGGMSVRTAAKCGQDDPAKESDSIKKASEECGGQLSLPKEAEMELAECLKVKAKWGFLFVLEVLTRPTNII